MTALDQPASKTPSEAAPLSFAAAAVANLTAELASRKAAVADMPESAGKTVHLGIISDLEKQIASLKKK